MKGVPQSDHISHARLHRASGENKQRSSSLREILSGESWNHHCCLDSFDYVTVHLVTDWVVQTRSIPERHTAEYMANFLQAAVADWGTADKVHDNASNKLNGFMSFRCKEEAHSINNLILKISRPTLTHFAYCELTWD